MFTGSATSWYHTFMLGAALTVIAGWYGHRLAAVAIAVASFLVQVLFVLPGIVEDRELLGAPLSNPGGFVIGWAVQILVVATIGYGIGSGVRAGPGPLLEEALGAVDS